MTQIAGVAALVALAALVGSLIYLHLAPTGLSPLCNAVSHYGITRYRAGYRSATIAFALAAAALAVGLASGAGAHENAGFIVALLTVFAIARAAISWFPMDAPGAVRTQTGATHRFLATAAFLAIALAALRLGAVLGAGARWHSLSGASTDLGWAMIVTLVAMLMARSVPAVAARFGAIERLFYVLAIVWSAVFALAFAT
jgi:hypothetical protein